MKRQTLNEEISRMRDIMRKLMNENDAEDFEIYSLKQDAMYDYDDDYVSKYDSDFDDMRRETNIPKNLEWGKKWSDFKSQREQSLKDMESLKSGSNVYMFRNRNTYPSASSHIVLSPNLYSAIEEIKRKVYDELKRYEGSDNLKSYNDIKIDPSSIKDITSEYSKNLSHKISRYGDIKTDFIEYSSDTEPYDDGGVHWAY